MRRNFHRAIPALLLAGLVSVAAPPCRAQSDVKLYEKRYALVVGIGTYENKHPDKKSWPSLPNAKGDAESVAKLLGKMGFEVTTLYNEDADRKGIMSKLNGFAKKLGEDDSFLFYFAGHGFTEALPGDRYKNYIVPYDAEEDSSTYIAISALKDFSKDMDLAKHQLFILDSCYGGALGDETDKAGEKDLKLAPNTPMSLREMTRPKAREVITAGMANEKVLDGLGETAGHSHFTGRLLEALNGAADLYHDGYITFSELKDYLNRHYANPQQHLHTGTLEGQKPEREFVFRNPTDHRRIQISQVYESQELSPGETEMVKALPVFILPRAIDWVRNSLHIWNLDFDYAGSISPVTRSEGGSGDKSISAQKGEPDYVLELKYTPIDQERLRVEGRFIKASQKLPDVLSFQAELNASRPDVRALAQKIVGQFSSNDLHLHIEHMKCEGCDTETQMAAEGAVRAWLSANPIPGIKFMKDACSEQQKDFNVDISLQQVAEGDRQVLNVFITVTDPKDGIPYQFNGRADLASLKDALQAAQKRAEAGISALVKQY